MRTPLPSIEPALRDCLRESWGIEAKPQALLVGGGGHHWTAGQWFVTAHELPGDPCAAYADLVASMGTAVALARGGLGFVVAVRPARDGRVVVPLGPYAVSVQPYLDAVPGGFFDVEPEANRVGIAAMLAELHRATVPGAPDRPVGLSGRAGLEDALGELRRPWRGGPYGEDARTVLARYERVLRDALARFDDLAVAGPLVLTHGEPHPGNLLRGPGGRYLIDWDTAGLAPPERDLWMTVWPPGAPGSPGLRAPVRRYARLTGRDVREDGLRAYRLRWYLDDIAVYTALLRGPHGATADTAKARDALTASLGVLRGLRAGS